MDAGAEQTPELPVPVPCCLRRGLRLKDGPESARASTVGVWLRWGFTLSPSARTGPSGFGPAGEGRSDSGVLHLHPQGQTATRRVADGERMNPQGRGGAARPLSASHEAARTLPPRLQATPPRSARKALSAADMGTILAQEARSRQRCTAVASQAGHRGSDLARPG